jgi:hypothetical protein
VRTQAVNAPRDGKGGKSPKGAKSAKRNAATSGKKASENSAREGSKTDAVLKLLRGSGGATLNDLMNATGWQAHSVRGFISGTVGRKMGLTVVSRKIDSGERAYSIND